MPRVIFALILIVALLPATSAAALVGYSFSGFAVTPSPVAPTVSGHFVYDTQSALIPQSSQAGNYFQAIPNGFQASFPLAGFSVTADQYYLTIGNDILQQGTTSTFKDSIKIQNSGLPLQVTGSSFDVSSLSVTLIFPDDHFAGSVLPNFPPPEIQSAQAEIRTLILQLSTGQQSIFFLTPMATMNTEGFAVAPEPRSFHLLVFAFGALFVTRLVRLLHFKRPSRPRFPVVV